MVVLKLEISQPSRQLRASKNVNYTRFFHDEVEKRPSRVLPTEKVSLANQAAFDANSNDSPLLRLSAEMRNRIWLLVFGGSTIHVCSRGGDTGPTPFCEHSTSGQAFVHVSKSNPALSYPEWMVLYGPCLMCRKKKAEKERPRQSMNLCLL